LAEDAENRIPHVRPGTSATLLMHLTRTIHPPAGSNPVIVILSVPGWHFLITPHWSALSRWWPLRLTGSIEFP
jgi:hypothetical protein